MGRVKLNKISSQAFEHEADQRALEALRKTVGFDRLVRALEKFRMDRVVAIMTQSTYLKVGPKQVPSLWALHQDVCDTLDMEPPPLYLANMPVMNAFTMGVEKPAIAVTSGLVDCLSDDEIRVVLGHELGHHMAGHVLYRTVAEHLKEILIFAGQLTFGLGTLLRLSLVPALMHWYRCAELTADRAGLLAVQDPRLVLQVEMKLASGVPGRFAKELDLDAFLEQAKASTIDDDFMSGLFRAALEQNLTHPWPVVRAQEIQKWIDSGEYQRILGGTYVRRASAVVAEPRRRTAEEVSAGETDEQIAAAAAEVVISASLARAYGVHVAPRVPEHPLHMALGSFVETLDPEERVLAFYDDTFSGTGDKGVLLTNRRIFMSARPKQGLRFDAIRTIDDLAGGLLSRPGLILDGVELRFHTREVRDAFRAAIEAGREVWRPSEGPKV